MPQISVVIITFNEENNIGRCIDSVKSIADDIVVVDSFSTDNTKKIALEKGARFIEHPFEGHIQQKNWAITQAKFPFVLSIDADEALNQELCKEIAKVKNNPTHDGYYFNRLNNYCGKWIKHSNWYPDRKLRLWDSRKGRWDGVNPHDTFILETGSTKRYLRGNLLHYTYNTLSQHVQQANKFSDISSESDYERGRRIGLLQICFVPKWQFFHDYILKLGFMDGYYGYVICKISAFAKYLKYTKMYEIQKAEALRNREISRSER